MLTTFLILFTGIITFSAQAQQTQRPFSIELNAGGGLIGNSTTNTAFQPEIGLSYMPGSWGVGVNAGIYSFDSDFSASQYQTGYEQFTLTEVNEDRWSSFFINAGPRFQKSLSRLVQFNLGLDLALSQQKAPSQSVSFYDSSGELESSGVDTDLVLADMNSGDDASGWSAAVRPQVQLEFTPGFSDRFSFNVKTGIQHHLSDREITYTERDLSRVMQVDNPFEMYSQFEQAPVVQRTESAPKTNIFANAGIKIRFGGSRAPAQDYNTSRSNKPSTIADGVGDGDEDSDDDGIEDAVETAKDYNSSRSNKPSTVAADVDGGGSGQQVVYITKDENGKVYAWGQRPEAKSQDGSGKVYSWGRVPETLASDSDGRVYAWGENRRASTQNGDGLVYSWGVAARAGALDDEGKIYAWGVRAQVEGSDSYLRGIDKKDIRRGMVIDSGPGQLGNALYLAKELGLAAAGNDIEIIKEALDRCDDGVCEQVRLNADKRHEGVRRALENPSGMDSEIEEILSIVREDVESLGKCETDVCRDVLAMEEDLLVKMNRLNDMEQIAPAQDYNSSRSNKPTSRAADVNDCDDDDDCVRPDDAVETAQDYNSSRSNKPRTEDGRGGNDGNSREIRFARLANPAGLIVRTGMVAAGGKKGYDYYLATQKSNNPLYEGGTSTGENPVYEGQANDGDSDNNDNQEPVSVQRFELQPGSYCVALSTMKISTNSQQAMRSGAQNPKPDMDEDGFPEMMKSASFSISKRSARTGRNPSGDEDMDSDGDGILFDLEIDPNDEDSDDDGVLDGIETASYSISKRSARTGRSTDSELGTMERMEGTARSSDAMDNLSESDDITIRGGGLGVGDPEIAMANDGPDDNVYQWSYRLNELEGGSDLPMGGTLTVLYTGGEWHFDLKVDPLDLDDDGDGLAEMLQNSSFSISKRSARM